MLLSMRLVLPDQRVSDSHTTYRPFSLWRPMYSVIKVSDLPVAQCVSVNVCKHHLAIRVGLGNLVHRVSELNRTGVCGSCDSCVAYS